MRIVRSAAFAAMSSLALLSTVANAASSCWYPNEAKAAQLRGLQTMLMVGTLQCRARHPSAEWDYNDFVRRQRTFLDANNVILRGRFLREGGYHVGNRDYDRYNTAVANQYSDRLDDPRFCWRLASLVRMASFASPDDLLRLARSVSDAPVSGACRPSTYNYAHAEALDREPLPRSPEERVPLVKVKAPVLEPTPATVPPAEAAPAAELAAEVVEDQAEPVAAEAVQAKLEPAPEVVQEASASAAAPVVQAQVVDAPVTRAEAVKAAIAALQAATAVLQAASEPASAEDESVPLTQVAPAPVVPASEPSDS